VLDYFLEGSEAYRRIIVVAGFEMFLGISFSVVENVEHFSFFVFEVVSVYFKLLLHLELLALKGRISSVR